MVVQRGRTRDGPGTDPASDCPLARDSRGVLPATAPPSTMRRMTETWRVAMDDGFTKFTRDGGSTGPTGDRRGPDRPKGDSRLPAHIMAAVRETVRAAAATCVEPSRLEASGPYEWLAIVEAHDTDLSGLLRGYIESCRYLDELQHHGLDVGHARRADAVRDAVFARDSLKKSLDQVIKLKRRAD